MTLYYIVRKLMFPERVLPHVWALFVCQVIISIAALTCFVIAITDKTVMARRVVVMSLTLASVCRCL